MNYPPHTSNEARLFSILPAFDPTLPRGACSVPLIANGEDSGHFRSTFELCTVSHAIISFIPQLASSLSALCLTTRNLCVHMQMGADRTAPTKCVEVSVGAASRGTASPTHQR